MISSLWGFCAQGCGQNLWISASAVVRGWLGLAALSPRFRSWTVGLVVVGVGFDCCGPKATVVEVCAGVGLGRGQLV